MGAWKAQCEAKLGLTHAAYCTRLMWCCCFFVLFIYISIHFFLIYLVLLLFIIISFSGGIEDDVPDGDVREEEVEEMAWIVVPPP